MKLTQMLSVLLMTVTLAAVPLSAADTSLSLEKTTFAAGEDILVTASGEGTDWVGIYAKGEVPGSGVASIYWYYVAQDAKPGEPVNLRETRSNGRAGYSDLPAGEYTVFLLLNDGYAVAQSVDVTILPPESLKDFDPSAQHKPDEPLRVSLDLPRVSEGLAEGTVTVELAEGGPCPDSVLLYWAERGSSEPLEGFTYLARTHCEGLTAELTLPANLIIPEGAGAVAACAENRWGTSACVSVDLPENAGSLSAGECRLKFQVVSDLHVNADPNQEHTRHFDRMLADVTETCHDSAGIFAAGDLADHGAAEEYERIQTIYENHPGAPELYAVVGNHDVSYGNSFASQLEQFIRYTGCDSLYYSRRIGGYLFLFLAGDQTGCPVRLPQEELDWLAETLSENAKPDEPIFLFCHESIVDTVAGSTPAEGWWGVTNGDKLAAILSEYPQAILFNGHSHWELSSKNEMYPADGRMCNAFNTSSVGYLWTGYRVVAGEYLYGSEGLYVEVYDDLTLVRGRDFENGLWTASAQYAVFGKGYIPPEPPETEEQPGSDEDQPNEPEPTTEGGCASVLPAETVAPMLAAAALLTGRRKKKSGKLNE